MDKLIPIVLIAIPCAWVLDKVIFKFISDVITAVAVRRAGITVDFPAKGTVRITCERVSKELKAKQEKYLAILLEEAAKHQHISKIELIKPKED